MQGVKASRPAVELFPQGGRKCPDAMSEPPDAPPPNFIGVINKSSPTPTGSTYEYPIQREMPGDPDWADNLGG